jgi:hypothetical protein
MRMSEQIDQIASASAKAQLELKPAAKDAVNPAFRSRYSDEAAIREASRVYAKHGIAIFQEPVLAERGVAVTTLFTHTSGQWIEFGPLTVPLGKQDAHGVGSATTYAKRYALSAAAGIASDEDVDGNAASQPAQASRPQAVTRAPEGFADFIDALEAVAVEGGEALKACWTKAPAHLRKHLTDTDNARWERIKAKSVQAQVSA